MNRYTILLAAILSISLLSSCTNNDNETLQTYTYCVYSADKFCADGPFTTCQENGRLSNTCPYNSSSSPSGGSSSNSKPSSSSNAYVGGSCNISSYRTKRIGNQTWMAENLNCNVAGSVCYNNDPANCTKYGRLYNWKTAMSVCPSGWHLPSKDDWYKLASYVVNNSSCSNCAGLLLKSTDGWYNNGNGVDKYDFSALPGGGGSSAGDFFFVGEYGSWWSSLEYDSVGAYGLIIGYDDVPAFYDINAKSSLVSVRCLQD